MQAFFALAILLLVNGANGFGWGLLGGGGGCGCAAPAPACAPAPVCAPPPPPMCAPQPVCPPPPPPQQLVCPPPQPCAPCNPPPPPPCPAPPPPPPPCPPPPPQPVCPPPQPQSCAPPPPAHNDCCNQCNSPCRFRTRRLFGAMVAQNDVNAMCNSDKLRNILLENMSESSSDSKRAIQKAAEDKLEGKYDVICGTGEFSYVVHSNTFCQETLNNITCYAFRH